MTDNFCVRSSPRDKDSVASGITTQAEARNSLFIIYRGEDTEREARNLRAYLSTRVAGAGAYVDEDHDLVLYVTEFYRRKGGEPWLRLMEW